MNIYITYEHDVEADKKYGYGSHRREKDGVEKQANVIAGASAAVAAKDHEKRKKSFTHKAKKIGSFLTMRESSEPTAEEVYKKAFEENKSHYLARANFALPKHEARNVSIATNLDDKHTRAVNDLLRHARLSSSLYLTPPEEGASAWRAEYRCNVSGNTRDGKEQYDTRIVEIPLVATKTEPKVEDMLVEVLQSSADKFVGIQSNEAQGILDLIAELEKYAAEKHKLLHGVEIKSLGTKVEMLKEGLKKLIADPTNPNNFEGIVALASDTESTDGYDPFVDESEEEGYVTLYTNCHENVYIDSAEDGVYINLNRIDDQEWHKVIGVEGANITLDGLDEKIGITVEYPEDELWLAHIAEKTQSETRPHG